MYIALEGVVGTGKSTQSKKLKTYLEQKYPEKEVVLVREPGGTIIAEAIRTLVQATEFPAEEMSPLTDIYLYAAARAQLLDTVVRPALARGAIVISDRSFASSLTIQGIAQGLGMQRVRDINKGAVMDTLPDALLFLDLDVDIGLSRTYDSAGDKFEKRKAEFSHKIYEGCEQLFEFGPTKKLMRRVDASGSIDQVFANILEHVEDICEEKMIPDAIPHAHYRVSAKAWVTDEEGRALFCYNCADAWDVLGGGIDHGEDPQEALRREIYEETDLEVLSVSDVPLYFDPFQTKNGIRRANVYYKVVLKNLDFTPSPECLELRYIAKDELDDYPLYERLKDVARNNLFG